MSQALEKIAQLTPAEIMLLSALGGGSAFGGMRLLTDMSHKVAPPKKEQTKIQLMMPDPSSHMPNSTNITDARNIPALSKSANVMGNEDSYAKYVAAIAGMPIGFMGAKTLYDHYQENQGNKQIADAKKHYMAQLAAAQQMNKISEETPLVDKFCEAIGLEFEKEASAAGDVIAKSHLDWKKMLGIGGAVGGLAAVGATADKIDNTAVRHFPKLMGMPDSNIKDVSPTEIAGASTHASPGELASAQSHVASQGTSGFNHAMNQMTGGMSGGAEDMWVGGAGAVGLGTLALLIHNHNKKKEREMKAQYPTGVEYAS